MSKMGKYFPFSDMRNFFDPERRMFYLRMIAAPYQGILNIQRCFFSY